MKLLYSLTTISLLSLSTITHAHSGKCDKESKKTCEEKKCDKPIPDRSVQYSVTGMTCEGCSSKVSKALSSLDGVTVKKVCHKSGSAFITIDSTKTDNSKIITAIESTGFKVTGEMLTIPVKGMTCNGCSSKVEKALAAIDGCTVSKVCHKSGQASIIINTQKISKEAVIAAINKTGFKAQTSVTLTSEKKAK